MEEAKRVPDTQSTPLSKEAVDQIMAAIKKEPATPHQTGQAQTKRAVRLPKLSPEPSPKAVVQRAAPKPNTARKPPGTKAKIIKPGLVKSILKPVNSVILPPVSKPHLKGSAKPDVMLGRTRLIGKSAGLKPGAVKPVPAKPSLGKPVSTRLAEKSNGDKQLKPASRQAQGGAAPEIPDLQASGSAQVRVGKASSIKPERLPSVKPEAPKSGLDRSGKTKPVVIKPVQGSIKKKTTAIVRAFQPSTEIMTPAVSPILPRPGVKMDHTKRNEILIKGGLLKGASLGGFAKRNFAMKAKAKVKVKAKPFHNFEDMPNLYVSRVRGGLIVQKRLKGKLVIFAHSQSLKLTQARQIARKVKELSDKFPGDKKAIFTRLKPFAKELGVVLTGPKFASCITRNHAGSIILQKRIAGKQVTFSYSRHLTLSKARLLARRIRELCKKFPGDREKIFKHLRPYAKEIDVPLCNSAKPTGIYSHNGSYSVRRRIDGKYVTFAENLRRDQAVRVAARVKALALEHNNCAAAIRAYLGPFAADLGVSIEGEPSYVVPTGGRFSVRKRFQGKETTLAYGLDYNTALRVGEKLRNLTNQHGTNQEIVFRELCTFGDIHGIRMAPLVLECRDGATAVPAPRKSNNHNQIVKREL